MKWLDERKSTEVIECGHPVPQRAGAKGTEEGRLRWKSTGTDGAFCTVCHRVFPVRTIRQPSRRQRLVEWLRYVALRIEGDQ